MCSCVMCKRDRIVDVGDVPGSDKFLLNLAEDAV